MMLTEEIQNKWKPLLEQDNLTPIASSVRRAVTLQLLENQERALTEATTVGNMAQWDPILISLVRRTMPKLIAYDLVGVQPMTGPSGLIFAMTSHYTGNASTGAEAFAPGIAPNAGWAGEWQISDTGATIDITGATVWAVSTVYALNDVVLYDGNYYNANTGFTSSATSFEADSANWDVLVPSGMATAKAEGLGGFNGSSDQYNEMSFKIEKSNVVANSRALKASYSTEIAQDMKAIHGLDAESEIANILSSEVLNEMNREILVRVNTQAKIGALTGTTTAGLFDLSDATDNRGARWGGERYKSLLTQINKEANIIGRETGRGAGNTIIASPDVVSILDMTGSMATPNLDVSGNLNTDAQGNVYAGMLGNKYKVFIDQHAPSDYVTVGYKGSSEMDAGIFYCPYIPMQMAKTVGEEDFQPRLGFKTRYGIQTNPFTSGNVGANQYYRRFGVKNL